MKRKALLLAILLTFVTPWVAMAQEEPSADHGTLSGDSNPYALLMEAFNNEISGLNCPAPNNVAVANIAGRSALVTWDGDCDSYAMEFRQMITPAVNTNTTYDFEDGTLQGWTSVSNDNDNDSWIIQDAGLHLHGGSYYLRSKFTSSSAGGDANNWLISPQIPLGGTLNFYAKKYSMNYTEHLQVYVSTTGNNISDFTAIGELISPSTSYELYEYDLSSFSGNGYVAIVHTAPNDQYYVYLDDISYTISMEGEYGEWNTDYDNAESPQLINGLTPETTYQVRVKGFCDGVDTEYSNVVAFTTTEVCPAPTGLAMVEGSLTSTSAQFIWDNEADAYWQYIVVAAGTAEEDYDWINEGYAGQTNNSGNDVENLQPATDYVFALRKRCEGEGFSDIASLEFTTPCEVIIVDIDHPFTEGFEGTAFPPQCWESVPYRDSYTGNTYQWTNQPSPVYSGNGSAYSNFYGPIYLIMPDIQISSEADAAQLSFWASFIYTQTHGRSSVVLIDGETETELWTPDEETLEDWEDVWEMVTIDLSAYVDQTISLAFKHVGNSDHGWYIDNIQVDALKIYTKEIAGYGTSDGGYVLLASPVGTVSPESVGNMLSNEYDLYRFNQTADKEWENYKAGTFDLKPSRGYLYANSEDVTLTFAGTPYNSNGQVTLIKDDNSDFVGWNLVGNPFAQTAYITKPFYKMNQDGTALSATTSTGAIEAMEGVFVIADHDGETLTFSTQEPGRQASALMLNVTQNRGAVIDRAIISFGEENALPKFMLNPNGTKLYIPQGTKDYAVVNAKRADEIPVSFKAKENGTYTLSFSSENTEFSYLYLIDNMTGADVDLLAGASTDSSTYTFEAATNDNENRFKIVFCIGSSNDVDSFAFFNGSNFVIANESEATLQVVDMMGHVLSSETISGNAEINVNQASGVYLLRLVNDDSVKVQKVVVK